MISFHENDNEYVSQSFASIKETATSINETIFYQIGRRFEQQILEEDLASLSEKLHTFYKETSDKIYSQTSDSNISPVESSTLLNVNKEIQTSAENLIKSLRLL